jgi:hypothetical protein
VAIDDQTPPVTTAHVAGHQQGGVYIGNVTVEFTATDDVAGVKSTDYSLDLGVTWKRYEVPVVFTEEGSYVIKYRSIDRVENVEQTESLNFTSLVRPTLNATLQGTQIQITWTPDGGRLETSPVLGPAAVWTTVGTNNPVLLPINEPNRFFRVVIP